MTGCVFKFLATVLGPREHVNQLTSYLDASQVYGSTEKEALRLRELSAGES